MPPSDINRTKPLIRLILNQIGRRLTEDLQAKAGRHRLLLMLDEFPALGRLDFFESALAFMAGYGLKSFLIAQSLNQIEKAYGANNSILDNCHVRVSFATNDERTAKRVSDALGTATEMRAMKNYAGQQALALARPSHGVALGDRAAAAHARRGDAASADRRNRHGLRRPPIRAKKARYYEGRALPGTHPAAAGADASKEARPDDWTCPYCRRAHRRRPGRTANRCDDEDPKHADRRRQPELGQDAIEKNAPIENEFALDVIDDDEDTPRISRMNDLMRGVAQQASLDPGDDLDCEAPMAAPKKKSISPSISIPR